MCRYYVNAGNVPKALQWIPSVSLIKQAFEGLCDNEFPGLQFEPKSADGTGDILQGEQVQHLTLLAPCYMPCLHSPCIGRYLAAAPLCRNIVGIYAFIQCLCRVFSASSSWHGLSMHLTLISSQALLLVPGLSQCMTPGN